MNTRAASPFSTRAVLALVLFGSTVFIALLWMLGAGMGNRTPNDGGAHVGGKGLNGYAALSNLLEKQGWPVDRVRNDGQLKSEGLMVLTPQHHTDPAKISAAIEQRRYVGPTLVILPKWNTMKIPAELADSKTGEGWVILNGAEAPEWANKIQEQLNVPSLITKSLAIADRQGTDWQGLGLSGMLPDRTAIQSLNAPGRLIPLVGNRSDAGIANTLAGYLADDGYYPDLAYAAGAQPGDGEDEDIYPVIVVAEPDLLNNYGMADRDRAMLALELISLAAGGSKEPVSFDLTLPGYGRSSNLLTLAFQPPFLAATLCLLIAAVAVGWRGFNRFGPAQIAARNIAFGKRALVSNAAGLIQRTGRLHLVAAPYADAARDRLARALALPGKSDSAETEAAIDRALAARAPGSKPFSAITATLRQARKPHDMLRAAQDLHRLERMLTK